VLGGFVKFQADLDELWEAKLLSSTSCSALTDNVFYSLDGIVHDNFVFGGVLEYTKES
jgi:hypothetical protein